MAFSDQNRLKTGFLILVLSATCNLVYQTTVASEMSATPLWEAAISNETQPCHFEQRNSSQGMGFLHGSALETCSIQINASLGYHTRIDTPDSAGFNKRFFFHIERKGNLSYCENRYLTIDGNNPKCGVVLFQDSVQLNLQGNVSIQINRIEATESKFICPESKGDSAEKASDCKNIKAYTKQVTCDLDSDGLCTIRFPYNCNATLGLREVVTLCYENEVQQIEESLITYPSGVIILDLSYNNIIKLETNAFDEGFDNLQKLNLHRNYLTTVPSQVFVALRNTLIHLTLNGNQLVRVDVNLFQDLNKLAILTLDDNKLTELPEGLFRSLENLNQLYLFGNQLISLNSTIFENLSRLTLLALNYNRLATLPRGLFLSLQNVNKLYLHGNQLATLDADAFQGLIRVTYISLRDNKLVSLPGGLYSGLEQLSRLFVYRNQINTIHSRTFQGLVRLTQLFLYNNTLRELPNDVFQGLENLNVLSLAGNRLVNLDKSTFHGLSKLRYLSLRDNRLQMLSTGVFEGLIKLYELYLNKNNIDALGSNLFRNLNNLGILLIHENRLTTLPNDLFGGLRNLKYLDLSFNKLRFIQATLFHGLFNMDFLFLNNNTLSNFDLNVFKDTVNVTFINLSENRLKNCPNINNLRHLSLLNIRNNELTAITHKTFTGLAANLELAVSQHEICECYVPEDVNCNAADNRSPYLTCDRLLSDRTLVVLMWFIGINALAGNIFVLVWRKKNTKQYKVQDLLLNNLAMSDSLMGFYMVIVAGADIYYGNYFPLQSETWRSGITCKVAGALSIASTELSVFFLTLISIDRLIGIKFPYSVKKLGKRLTVAISVLIWVSSLALGIVPSLLSGHNFKFYDNSHVCIGLPLALTKTYSYEKTTATIRPENTNLRYFKDSFTTEFEGLVNGLYFSTALFLGLNCICYLIILGCYVEIVRAVMKSAKQSGRTPDMDEQIRLTRKVTAIVATDFLCIFPIIVLGILVQTRVIELPPSVYAWSVTFVLPINSAINPYLYTIAEIISRFGQKKSTPMSEQTMSSAN